VPARQNFGANQEPDERISFVDTTRSKKIIDETSAQGHAIANDIYPQNMFLPRFYSKG
jgi:hypothetical protein